VGLELEKGFVTLLHRISVDSHESVDKVQKSGKDVIALQVLVVGNIFYESTFYSNYGTKCCYT
jgi:hypothetical protein